MFYLVFIFALSICLGASFYFIKKSNDQKLTERIIKISTVAFLTLSLLDVFLPDLFMCSHELDALNRMGGEFHAMLRWLNLVCFTVLPIAVFQKNKYFEKIASFFCLPISIINVAFFFRYIDYFTAQSNSGLQTVRIIPLAFKEALNNEAFRSVYFGATCLAQIVALVILTYRNKKSLALAKNEIVNFVLILLGVTYMSLPIYVPQYLSGHINVMMTRFSPIHIGWILGMVAIVVALYFIFRNKSYEARYLLVLSMAWALMMQFSQMFTASGELNVMKLPLQLCNLGSYLALAMLLKRNEKIYHFALIVNVVGAVIAILILDIGKDISHLSRLWVIHYIVEHTKVLLVPILCLVLKIYKPITLRSFKHFAIGFSIYYAFVFVLGTISNGFYRIYEGEYIQNFFYSNHLFMFDREIAEGIIGFTGPLFDTKIAFGHFEIYPIVQVAVYLSFMLICTLVFFLIYGLTRKQRKALTE